MLYTHRCTVAIKFNGLLRDNGGQKSSKQSHDASSSLIGDLRFGYTDGRGSTGHRSVFLYAVSCCMGNICARSLP